MFTVDDHFGSLYRVGPSLQRLGMDPVDNQCGPVVTIRHHPLCPFKLGDCIWTVTGDRIYSRGDLLKATRAVSMSNMSTVEVQVLRPLGDLAAHNFALVTLPLIPVASSDTLIWSTPKAGKHFLILVFNTPSAHY